MDSLYLGKLFVITTGIFSNVEIRYPIIAHIEQHGTCLALFITVGTTASLHKLAAVISWPPSPQLHRALT